LLDQFPEISLVERPGLVEAVEVVEARAAHALVGALERRKETVVARAPFAPGGSQLVQLKQQFC